ncbi:MAG: hypothetical protein NTZ09_14795, partial [Candidatus Hydrogenedentes bacterium]|nr:hypothetical protein [Candidatus Hydrogenedentota bacterium]
MNVGAGPINWSATTDGSWLDVTPPAGTLEPGTSTVVTAALNSMADYQIPGVHAAQITFTDSTNDVVILRDARLSIDLPAPVTFYDEPMDSDPGWLTEGMWEFGLPLGECLDPAEANTGSTVYGFNLSGCYSNDMPEYFLTSAPINCAGFANVSLSFFRWLSIEDATVDNARVQVSNDSDTWVDVWAHTGGGFSDSQWNLVAYDISGVADGQPAVYIRWSIGPTNGSVVYGGWNIDDVSLQGSFVDPLVVTPDAPLETAGCQGGPFDPNAMVYTLANTGPDSLNWAADASQDWLDLSSAGGTLGLGESTTVTVTINANANALVEGRYVSNVAFTNLDTGAAITRSAALEITGPPPQPANPTPATGATGVMLDTILTWNNFTAESCDAIELAVDPANVFEANENRAGTLSLADPEAQPVTPETSGGPDPGGYIFIDSNEPGGPAFSWIEVSSTGTNLNLTDNSSYFPIDLPFTFNFYDGDYTQVAVGSNGTVYFSSAYLGLGNVCIPGINGYGVHRFIALYWDDLYPSGAN